MGVNGKENWKIWAPTGLAVAKCSQGCGHEMRQKEIDVHKQNECLPVLKCSQGCGHEMRQKEMDVHKQNECLPVLK